MKINIGVKFLLFTNILVLKKQNKTKNNSLLQGFTLHFFPLCIELSFSNEQFNGMAKVKIDY